MRSTPLTARQAWCNIDVQQTIRKARVTDESKTVQSDPMYRDFERLAKSASTAMDSPAKDLDKQYLLIINPTF